MEDNFRTVLIVISAVVITAIFVHGFWTIRKNKNPYKLKAKSEKIEPQERGFDGSGFDQDGVSKPRIVENPLTEEVSHHEVPMSALDEITQQTVNNVPDLQAEEESLFEQVKAEEQPVVEKVEVDLYQAL